MQHSVIIKIGENLVYQQAPTPKPIPESTSSPVEYNRALPEWEHTAKNYLVKKADESQFAKYIDENPEMLTRGIKIPFEEVELYEDGTGYPKRKYARYGASKPVVVETQQTQNKVENLELEKYCNFYRNEKGVLFVKCKNVSILEMKTAEEEFLQKEQRENAQPKDDANHIIAQIIPYCTTDGVDGEEQKENAKKIALIIVKMLMVEDALLNPKRLAHLEKVKQEIEEL